MSRGETKIGKQSYIFVWEFFLCLSHSGMVVNLKLQKTKVALPDSFMSKLISSLEASVVFQERKL
ncbi:hypothetical protein RchiOBHm_Chr2g0131611 [Rosa chinensis]|uniref:Uncharacterized protein n=1 Tax=Rosa chinensis TaxID=74649 RepID=A0A2P6RV38_ROSCH|nr:hypothetical protein RchiOBHm_Chr2g0131611 [Rosa chinensis]